MRKFAKLLIPALLVVVVMVACSVMFASAATKTVYISATGTGDGSSAASPLGPDKVTVNATGGATQSFTDANYADVIAWIGNNAGSGKISFDDYKKLVEANVIYKAFKAIGADGGTIVVVGEVAVDAADNFQDTYAGDFTLPEAGDITIKGNDANAKFILDHAKTNSTNLIFSSNVTFKDINIVYNYESNMTSNYNLGFHIFANGKNLTFDTGVTVTSFDYKTGSPVAGSWLPSIFAGHRKTPVTANPVITVKSGSFGGLYTAGHSINPTDTTGTAKVTGTTKVVVEGGRVDDIYFGGPNTPGNRKYSYNDGNVELAVKGGKVNEIHLVTGAGVKGTVKIDISGTAQVGKVTYKKTDLANVDANIPTSAKVAYVKGTVTTPDTNITGFEAADITANDAPTTPPQQQQPQNPPQTGSALTLIAVVAVVALAGSAVVISKKII